MNGYHIRKLTGREKLLSVCISAAAFFLMWEGLREYLWIPDLTVTSAHYVIYSSASRDETAEVSRRAEMLYAAYAGLLKNRLPEWREGAVLKMKLFASRDEFRFWTSTRDWAEGFYRYPYAYQYCASEDENPYHWMLHEAVHQLNFEVTRLRPAKWLDEGLATYFSTALIEGNQLKLGSIDPHTYPVWWFSIMATSGDARQDAANGSIIPLRSVITNSGGPHIDQAFNLYYLHWWTLVHFLFEGGRGRYREGTFRLLREGGSLAGFERKIGPLAQIEREWYAHVRGMKKRMEVGSSLPLLNSVKIDY